MNYLAMLERLRELAASRGIEIRSCPTRAKGGIVMLRGSKVVFLPEFALPEEALDILAEALAEVDFSDEFVPPEISALIEAAKKSLDQ